ISHAYGTGAKWVFCEALCPAIIFHEPDDGGIGQHPQIAGFVRPHTLCAEAIHDFRRASNLSCLLVQMEQTALANKPDVPMTIRDNVSDPPDKLTIADFQIMSKCSGRWIKLVE